MMSNNFVDLTLSDDEPLASKKRPRPQRPLSHSNTAQHGKSSKNYDTHHSPTNTCGEVVDVDAKKLTHRSVNGSSKKSVDLRAHKPAETDAKRPVEASKDKTLVQRLREPPVQSRDRQRKQHHGAPDSPESVKTQTTNVAKAHTQPTKTSNPSLNSSLPTKKTVHLTKNHPEPRSTLVSMSREQDQACRSDDIRSSKVSRDPAQAIPEHLKEPEKMSSESMQPNTSSPGSSRVKISNLVNMPASKSSQSTQETSTADKEHNSPAQITNLAQEPDVESHDLTNVVHRKATPDAKAPTSANNLQQKEVPESPAPTDQSVPKDQTIWPKSELRGDVKAKKGGQNTNPEGDKGSGRLEIAQELWRFQLKEFEKDHDKIAMSLLREANGQPKSDGNDGAWSDANKTLPGITEMEPSTFRTDSPFIGLSGTKGGQGKMEKTTTTLVSSSDHKKHLQREMTTLTTSYRSNAVEVPTYYHYISLKNNVLAENERKLTVWPHFDKDLTPIQEKDLHYELRERYTHAHPEHREGLVERTARTNQWGTYIHRFLQSMKCSGNDLLVYLLRPSLRTEVKMSSEERDAWAHRDAYFSPAKTPNRSSVKWSRIYASLPKSNEESQLSAAIASAAFQDVSDFGIWQFARTLVSEHSLKSNALPKDIPHYSALACTVCHLHNCPYHGTVSEKGDGDGSESDDVNSVDESESILSDDNHDNEKSASVVSDRQSNKSSADSLVLESNAVVEDINRRKRLRIGWKRMQQQINDADFEHDPESAWFSLIDKISAEKSSLPMKTAKKGWKQWYSHSKTGLQHSRPPFFPCDHEGTCEQAQCSCYREDVTCEKSCSCSVNCPRRFQGCSCARANKACWQNEKCDCFRLDRECDPDLCGTCGAAEVLDPRYRGTKDIMRGRCWNVGLQRNVPKRTLMGTSEVAGFGLYAGEALKKDEFIAEYKGEILGKEESDRRGAIYHYRAMEYLSMLNGDQEIDGTLAGTKTRFINNASMEENITCYQKRMLCDTVTRLGLYAKRDIEPGEELFFDYGYPPEAKVDFREKTKDGLTKLVRSKSGGVVPENTRKPGQANGQRKANVASHGGRSILRAPSIVPSNDVAEVNGQDDGSGTAVPATAQGDVEHKGDDRVSSASEKDSMILDDDGDLPLPSSDSQDSDYYEGESKRRRPTIPSHSPSSNFAKKRRRN